MKRLNLIKPLITLRTDNDFFVVRILQRRKDNPEMDRPERQLKVYSFYSWEEFDKQKARIMELCILNNARAYIRLNTQNAYDISLRMQKEIADNLINDCAWKNEGIWNSVSGKGGSKDWWVLDLDTEHLHLLNLIKDELAVYFNLREEKIIGETVDKMNKFIGESKSGLFGKMEPTMVAGKYGNMFPLGENPTKSGVHLLTRPFDTRILDKFNKELSAKGIPTIQIQKDANTVLYIGNE